MKDLLFHALSHPCRRQIVAMLHAGSMNAGDIAGRFDISQPSVSRHLMVLKKAKLVTTQRYSNQVLYSLNVAAIQELILYSTQLLTGQE